MKIRRLMMAIAAALSICGGAASAHPKLVSADPVPNTAGSSPARIVLRFSEKLVPAFSKAALTTGKATVASTAVVSGDGRTLVVTPRDRLRSGRYSIAWTVVSVDTHRVAGSYAFAVK